MAFAVQLPPAQIKVFALSMGKRAKSDQINAELIARFLALRLEVGRTPPDEKLQLLRSIPDIGLVSVAMLLAEMPELGRMTATEAAAMTGLAPMAHDSGAMRGKRVISGGRRSLRHVLFQAGLAVACHNPVLKVVAKRMKQRGKPHKLVIVGIARRLITITNAVLKTGLPWRVSSAA
ncbi:IS110 family transposase [Gluconobacter cerinus]|uniref:Transposase n=1 Tax=Gluconobacter cerinus TaxID=38307 RepID=A0A1B6VFY4_9PROT|nr:IS110 family transposase [Gluconobacter cerinus]OAJ66125.1 transposase [Gluconobacter cerinus]